MFVGMSPFVTGASGKLVPVFIGKYSVYFLLQFQASVSFIIPFLIETTVLLFCFSFFKSATRDSIENIRIFVAKRIYEYTELP